MMPLAFAKTGEQVMIARVGGNQEMKKHLEDLGFTAGTHVHVISAGGDGNIIVNLKDSRLGITEEMAKKIMIV